MDAKELRQSEAKVLEARVTELKAVVSQEQAERQQQEERLHRLHDENAQLRREIDEEKRRGEWQKAELKRAEVQHEDVMAEHRRLVKQARSTEELTDEVNARCADLTQQQKTLKSACLELKAELVRLKGEISNAQATLQNRGDHSELRQVYEEKLRIWNALEKPAKFKEDVDFMLRENRNLKSNLGKANAEHEQLSAALKMMEDAIHRTQVTKKMLLEENKEIIAAMGTLNHDSLVLQQQEAAWSSDTESEDSIDAFGALRRAAEGSDEEDEDDDDDDDTEDSEEDEGQSAGPPSQAHEDAIASFFRSATRPDPRYVQQLQQSLHQ
eukprot:TRINITY_DN39078_c0_g1_i1.p2 TRINITY_DN39078_c0_g1~~TRINITY_DN39078_c0_g1_i1.p2  ORF type:complete len:349 (+),score=178.58 TRINITY_DN39078_c0_g1_i1:72-1049(+)